jgi:hypothetical protein
MASATVLNGHSGWNVNRAGAGAAGVADVPVEVEGAAEVVAGADATGDGDGLAVVSMLSRPRVQAAVRAAPSSATTARVERSAIQVRR